MNKRNVLIAFGVISAVVLVVVGFKWGSDDGNPIADYNSYMPFYHEQSEEAVDNLKRYDMVILKPLQTNADTIESLHESDTAVYAYQSALGVELVNEVKQGLMKDGDYLELDGVRPKHEYFNYEFGDIRSEHYREVLLEMIQTDVVDAGYDGVFYDTLDDVNMDLFQAVGSKSKNTLKDEFIEGYIEFFKLVEDTYPDLSVIQNRAFDLYEAGSAQYVDALMFEGLQYEYFDSEDHGEFHHNLKDSLNKVADKHNSVILSLSYENPEENYEEATEFGWRFTFYDPENEYMTKQNKIFESN